MSKPVPNSIDEISEADWSQTPESVKRLVQSLLGRIEQVERQAEELRAEVATLQEQVKRNSKSSSQPPSQDSAKGFKPKVKRTGNKKARGAQWGHEGHETTYIRWRRARAATITIQSAVSNAKHR
jgi:transposase